MTSMSSALKRSTLGAALFAIALAPAFAMSGGGGGGGNGGGGSSTPPVVCKKGWVWSQQLQRCVSAKSGSLDDKQLLQQGRALALAGYYENALSVLDAVGNKNDSEVLTYIGYSHRKMGDTDVGIGFYKQALAIDPKNVNTREYLGEGYLSAGKVELAKAELTTIEQLCGNRECEQYTDLANALAGKPE